MERVAGEMSQEQKELRPLRSRHLLGQLRPRLKALGHPSLAQLGRLHSQKARRPLAEKLVEAQPLQLKEPHGSQLRQLLRRGALRLRPRLVLSEEESSPAMQSSEGTQDDQDTAARAQCVLYRHT